MKITSIEDLGYDDFFESHRQEMDFGTLPIARVIAEHKGAYQVKNIEGEYLAKVTGKQMFKASSREDFPVVGDWVAITELSQGEAVINGILPRRTTIKRKYNDQNSAQVLGANIEVAFVIESVDRDYNLNRIERYLAIVSDGGAKPVVILNKVDLISSDELDLKLAQLRERFNTLEIMPTSVVSRNGLDDLKDYLEKGKTYCFLGSSGVGKSSLINKLLGGDTIKTGEISGYSGRGQHITTARQMYFLDKGAIVIDNPGMREVGLTNTKLGVNDMFAEITEMARQCKYADCSHTHEPDCEVLRAVNSGRVDEAKYANYISLKKEADFYDLNNMEKRNKDRKFGKFLKKAKKDFRD